jgi:adenylyltransferase/sulfurtransferase
VTRPAAKYRAQERLWGEAAQAAFAAARVAVFGVGGTGAAHAHILARAGVGFLRVVDRDVVEFGDLHRAQLYDEADAGAPTPKATAAARRLAALNADCRVEPVVARVSAANVAAFAADADVVVDGSDNFPLRLLLNDVAVKTGKPFIYQGAVAERGAVMAVVPGAGPCLRCLVPRPPAADAVPTCARVGVSPAVVAGVGAAGAGLTLAVLRGEGAAVAGLLHGFDGARRLATVAVPRRDDCPCCGRREFAYLEGGRAVAAGVDVVCGGGAFEIRPAGGGEGFAGLAALEKRLARAYRVKRAGQVLALEDGTVTAVFFEDGRAIIYGARDASDARARYETYTGS